MITDWITALIIAIAIIGLFVAIDGFVLGRHLRKLRQMNLDVMETAERNFQQARDDFFAGRDAPSVTDIRFPEE